MSASPTSPNVNAAAASASSPTAAAAASSPTSPDKNQQQQQQAPLPANAASTSRHRGQSHGGRRSFYGNQPHNKFRADPQLILSNVAAADLRLLNNDTFSSGMAEAVVAIRSKRKFDSAVVKGAMFHFAGSTVSDFVDHYYLVRVFAPEGDPGGSVLYLLKLQNPETGEFLVKGVDLVIPVRGIVGVGATSIADADPVKHFRVSGDRSHATGRTRVQPSFVQGQVALEITTEPAAVEEHLRKENSAVPASITGMRKVSQLPDNKIVLCYESMEERNQWLDFLTNLLMNVETADLRMEELQRRRRNKTIGPTGSTLEPSLLLPDGTPGSPSSSANISSAAVLGPSKNLPLGPPPRPSGITTEDITAYRMFHFKPENLMNGGFGASGGGVAAPGQHLSISDPPCGGVLDTRLRGETEYQKRKISSRATGTLLVSAVDDNNSPGSPAASTLGSPARRTLDLNNALVQATTPYSCPFHVVKVPFDAASAQAELENGGPIKILECRAGSPEERVKWIDWLVFVRGAPQAEDDTYTYRAVEKKHMDAARAARSLGAEEEVSSPLLLASPSSPGGKAGKASFSGGSSSPRNLKVPSAGARGSDRSSLTSVGSHQFSKSKTFGGAGAGDNGKSSSAIHDPWRDLTWGHQEEEIEDPRSMKGLLYDTGIDWSLPGNMQPMPLPYSPEESAKMFKKREETKLREMTEAVLRSKERSSNSSSKQPGGGGNNSNNNESASAASFSSNTNSYYAPQIPSSAGGSMTREDLYHDRQLQMQKAAQLCIPQYHVPQSAATEFVTRGVWAYVQINAAGMPPMADEASFNLRYFFAAFGGCAPEQRARHGSIMIMHGTAVDKVWLTINVDDIVGLQVGSRCAGPLSFVLRVRDPQCNSVLRVVVVCGTVLDRLIMVQFLLRAGGLNQLPATILSDFVMGPSAAQQQEQELLQQLRHGGTGNDAADGDEHNDESGDDRHLPPQVRLARAAALTYGRPNGLRGVTGPSNVLDTIEQFIRHGGKEEEAEEEDHFRDEQPEVDETRFGSPAPLTFQGTLTTSFAVPSYALGSDNTNDHQHHLPSPNAPPSRQNTAPASPELSPNPSANKNNSNNQQQQQQKQRRPRGYSEATNTSVRSAGSNLDRTTTVTSGGGSDDNDNSTTGGSMVHTPTHNAEDDKKKAVAETLLMATADPTTCQLCGAPNKAESSICKATGLFHPEFLSARALERHFGGAGAVASVLHFMAPQRVIPRADITETLKRYAAAARRAKCVEDDAEGRKLQQEKEQLSAMADAVIARYKLECSDLIEEADILLFSAALCDDAGPVKITSKAAREVATAPGEYQHQVSPGKQSPPIGGGGGDFNNSSTTMLRHRGDSVVDNSTYFRGSSKIVNELLRDLPLDGDNKK